MKLKATTIAVCSALGVGLLSQPLQVSADNEGQVSPELQRCEPRNIKQVEFLGMEPPATVEEKADVYTGARMKVTYKNGEKRYFRLKYHQLMATTDLINGSMVGGLYNVDDEPLLDLDGQMASDAPDGSSLINIRGLRSDQPWRSHALALINQYEYKELPPNDGVSTGSFWSKLPAAMSQAKLDQNKWTGALTVVDYAPISFSDVNGGWIHCGSTLSRWNTHVGSEEYEPDAKTREGLPKAADSDDGTDIDSFSEYYFGSADVANPYDYGLVPEVKLVGSGNTSVVKHHAMGRFAREMQEIASDNRTAIGGDDGKNTGLFMFVADAPGELSAGTIYAAKVTQTSADNGGSFSVEWIRLGHATDREIQKLVDSGIKFSDIFDVLPADTTEDTAGYKLVTSYMGTEWLRLKPQMKKAAAFLETRRYAALRGATTEFSKMEYVAFNKADRKFYLTVSRVEAGMADTSGDIQVARNDGGIILEMSTRAGQTDTNGDRINSSFVGTKLVSIPELVGGWPLDPALYPTGTDAEGNRCEQDKLCGPDNLRYVDSIRTLFLGEDTSRRNNNYVWAFNIDTRNLSRILSVPMAAEATGLMVAPSYNGHAYILSNFQHPGEGDIGNYTGDDREAVLEAINNNWDNKKKAAIGYIGTQRGALPAFE